MFLFLGGDFNVAKEGLNDIDHHFPLSSSVPRANYGTAAKNLNDVFSFLTEIVIDEPTHYTQRTGRLSFIDRAAYVTPPWLNNFFHVEA